MKIKNYRNIGICAHIDAGKTTTTERILYYSGINYKLGEVHEGKATMDWMSQEKERGITISSACTTINWKYKNIFNKVNIIDTPGHVDFTLEVERSMRVLDGICMLFCSVGGVQPQSETIWRQIKKYSVPRIFFINKMDRIGANFDFVLKQINKKLKGNAIKIQIPIYKKKVFEGIIDLISMKEIYFCGKNGEDVIIKNISKKRFNIANKERKNMIETLVSKSTDHFLNKYLEDKITEKDINNIIKNKTIECKISPVLCGSAFKNRGVQCLLDAVIKFLPYPNEKNNKVKCFYKNKNKYINLSKEENFSSLVFKIINDQFLGQLLFLRIYSGRIRIGSLIKNSRNRSKFKVGRILQIHADKRNDIKQAKAGDIIALTGVKDAITGDTFITSTEKNFYLEKIHFPEPVISISISPINKSEQEKLMLVIRKLIQEDPSIKIKLDEENGDIIISGMGELHIEVFIDRISRENNINIKSSKPRVAYRETIKNKCIKEGKYIRQSGGRGQYGHVVLSIKPLKRGEGIKFIDRIKGGVIPKEYIPSIKKSIYDTCNRGILLGYPVIDIEVSLLDGSFHEVDSSENAFKIASSIALKEAIKHSNPYILEPIMEVVIETPEKYLGNIIGNISSKRGIIISNKNLLNFCIIKSYIPLNEMFDFSTPLRSLSQGRASYSMKFYIYKKLPNILYEKIK
ncbi:elongation factor G [Candidatus Vidania fulgoroideae]|nr:elongation factor G [Candidatus Vidania fulgoroideae]